MNRVITISREFGSGGRTIGKHVADKLGIPCYDAELIEKIAQGTGYTSDYVREVSEEAADTWLSNVFTNRTMWPTNQDRIWEVQSHIITDLAEKESCVIVGRCADYLLRNKADCLNVFIYADAKKRADRIVKEYGESHESPMQRIREKDRRRDAYHRFYTDAKWGQAQNYDICLNSGVLGIDKCVDLIVGLY